MFLFPLGIRRLVSSFSIYINNSPSYYRSKTWFFSNSPIFKNLDFFAYMVALLIASFSNFFLFLAFSSHPVYKFSWVVLVSSGLVLKGTWVLQVGLSLYSDEFAFKGCGKVVVVRGEGSADVKCVLDEDKLRGVALMHLLFVGHSIIVLILCFVIMGHYLVFGTGA
ncbi:APC membrane recruitment protein like protein [Tanacetum coccineum]